MRSPLFFSFCIVGIILVAIVYGCTGISNNNRIEGDGKVISQPRAVSGLFNEISLQGDFTVIVIPHTSDSIQLSAESNILSNIITEVQNNSLIIRNTLNTTFNPNFPIVIHVFARNIGSIDLAGSGTIQADSIPAKDLSIRLSGSGTIKTAVHVDNLSVTLSGAGDVNIRGIAKTTKYSISGSGNINSYLLSQQNCYVSVIGSGNTFVSAWQSLKATISGSGSVFYKDNPVVISTISGSGKVIPG